MRRCAFRGNKKAKYYSVAAILYRVFIGFCILPAPHRSKPVVFSRFSMFKHVLSNLFTKRAKRRCAKRVGSRFRAGIRLFVKLATRRSKPAAFSVFK